MSASQNLSLLSARIAALQAALAQHGDMPVLRMDSEGYEDTFFAPEEVRLVKTTLLGDCYYSLSDYEGHLRQVKQGKQQLTAADTIWQGLTDQQRTQWKSKENYMKTQYAHLHHSAQVVEAWPTAPRALAI